MSWSLRSSVTWCSPGGLCICCVHELIIWSFLYYAAESRLRARIRQLQHYRMQGITVCFFFPSHCSAPCAPVLLPVDMPALVGKPKASLASAVSAYTGGGECMRFHADDPNVHGDDPIVYWR